MSHDGMLYDPVFCEPTRVWRCYLGGKLLDEFLGNPAACDGYFPEDWLASITRADNGERQQAPDEGLSRVKGSGALFADVLRDAAGAALGPSGGGELGVLCKFLDSAIRLPIQCHPDRAFARLHFHSPYGKTESWLILATRELDGEEPCVLMGFRPEATPERFRAAIEAQDVQAMTGCLHRFPVRPGDGFIIPGRLPHAIGPGVMLLEVQEPTDLVIQPERRIGDVTLSEAQMWGGLDHDTAFGCFDCRGESAGELRERLALHAVGKRRWPGATLEGVIGPDRTDCFRVDRLTFSGRLTLDYDAPWYLGIVTKGEGTVTGLTGQRFGRGDRFFVSHRIRMLEYRTAGAEPAEIYLVSREPSGAGTSARDAADEKNARRSA